MPEEKQPKRPRARPVQKKPVGRYHHGDLRRALLGAALVLVEREGKAALTLRAAARLLGVSEAAPYRHFADKEALLVAVAEDGLRTLATFLREAAAPHEAEPARRFQALGVAYVTFATVHPAHFRVMFTAVPAEQSAYPSLAEAYEGVFSLLIDAIVACQHRGLVRKSDPRALALAAWSTVHGLADLVVGGQVPRLGLDPANPAQLAAMVTERLFVGLSLPAK